MSFPYNLAEELALGSPGPTGKLRRWLLYCALRLILWLALIFGILVLFSGHVLLALLAPYLIVGSLGQRFGANWIRSRTASPAAAALFSAILTAWFISAIFPLV